MNIFFKISGKFITPSLDGSVLAGVTRSSVIALLRHKGFEVTERVVSMNEIVNASQNGTLEEAFGTGTAVGIAMIDEIGYRDQMIKMPESNPVSQDVNQTINRIKTQTEQDPFGWIVPVMEKQLV
jgi:branched-chain amino acid aminotransferase